MVKTKPGKGNREELHEVTASFISQSRAHTTLDFTVTDVLSISFLGNRKVEPTQLFGEPEEIWCFRNAYPHTIVQRKAVWKQRVQDSGNICRRNHFLWYIAFRMQWINNKPLLKEWKKKVLQTLKINLCPVLFAKYCFSPEKKSPFVVQVSVYSVDYFFFNVPMQFIPQGVLITKPYNHSG